MHEYTTEDEAQFAAIRAQLRKDGLPRRETRDIAHAAQLAPLLRSARTYLSSFHPRVCMSCHCVFSPDTRLDMRCPTCAQARLVAHGIAPLPQGGD